ncbi:glucosamine-6-phosphate deaminase [Naasia sp. SYSU D00948]|uniref:glucosamine-6-phosphate deaminase n=1 Tax=Naasia sp. SYSU D00948 TaxID=2817379 RepID=UPI001B30B6CC|nr:glucosamine-6-phosphate deaminase [Naasia sp. SYSU D00948]
MAEVIIVADEEQAGALGAEAVAALVAWKPDAVLGVATGSTPLPVYRALAARSLDLSRVSAFALDEYVGLPLDAPQSYHSVIAREVTEPLGLDPARVHVPGEGPLEEAGEAYERDLRDAGGVDLQILGIGTDGHIGFNEPGSSLASLTRIKTLTEQTRRDNARFFRSLEEVPIHCITQGLGTILRARHLLLLAFGEGKADALAAAVEGPVSARVPGSVIQLHPRVTVLVDDRAASRLEYADYYRYAYANKPSWQPL